MGSPSGPTVSRRDVSRSDAKAAGTGDGARNDPRASDSSASAPLGRGANVCRVRGHGRGSSTIEDKRRQSGSAAVLHQAEGLVAHEVVPAHLVAHLEDELVGALLEP